MTCSIGFNGMCTRILTSVEMEIQINEVCRRFGKPFYAGGCFGLLGYIFCDLLKHDYITP